MRLFVSSALLVFILFYAEACTSSDKSTKTGNNEDENYVFDDIPFEDSTLIKQPDANVDYNYFIQIGAFSTLDNAEVFAAESRKILKEELVVEKSDKTKLYIVRLRRIFGNRLEAIKARNELWQYDKFNDSWIFKRPN